MLLPWGFLCDQFRWLTHTGSEVPPSGLNPNSRIFCKIHYRAGSLREIYYELDLCRRSTTFAPLRLCVVFFPKQPYARSVVRQPVCQALRRCQPSVSWTNWTSKRVPLWPTVGPCQLRKMSPKTFFFDS